MVKYDKLSNAKLAQWLDTAQQTRQLDVGEVHRLLHELQEYLIELEVQNRELREANQRLKEALDQYVDLYDSAPVGYLTLDRNGAIQSINLAGAYLLGKGRATLLKTSFAAYLAPDQSMRFFSHLDEVFRSTSKVVAEVKIRGEGGALHDVRLESVAMRRSGEPPYICRTAMIDVTEQTRAGAQLRRAYDELEDRVEVRTAELRAEVAGHKRAKDKLRQAAIAFENISEGLLIFDPNGQIILANRALTWITGYTAEEVQGRSVEMLVCEEGRDGYQDLWARLRGTGRWQGELCSRRKSGEVFPAWLSISAVNDEHGNTTSYVCVFSDITVRKRAEEHLDYLAHHDVLTGLSNRLAFATRLENALARAKRYGHRLGVLYIDVDRFKEINDTLGHAYGDRLLQVVARRLKGCVREEDTVARLGGDEFAIILDELKHRSNAAQLAQKIVESIAEPIDLDGERINTSASVGISLYPDDALDGEQLVKTADQAMYAVKRQTRTGYRFYGAK